MQDIYIEIYNIWKRYQLPLTKYEDLKQWKSTIPSDFLNEHNRILDVISTVLLTILSNNLPRENRPLQDIFTPYCPESNGYGALYALVWQRTLALWDERLNWANTPFTNNIESQIFNIKFWI